MTEHLRNIYDNAFKFGHSKQQSTYCNCSSRVLCNDFKGHLVNVFQSASILSYLPIFCNFFLISRYCLLLATEYLLTYFNHFSVSWWLWNWCIHHLYNLMFQTLQTTWKYEFNWRFLIKSKDIEMCKVVKRLPYSLSEIKD